MDKPVEESIDICGSNEIDKNDLNTVLSQTQDEILEIDQDLLVYKAKVQRLEQRRSELKSLEKRYTYLLSSVGHVPDDIIYEIFSHVLSQDGVYCGYRKLPRCSGPDIFSLSTVCSIWRGLLLSNSYFWSKVKIVMPHPEASISAPKKKEMVDLASFRLNLCLQRCKIDEMVLNVTTSGRGRDGSDDPFCRAFMKEFEKETSRWKSIHFDGVLASSSLSDLKTNFPNLRHLGYDARQDEELGLEMAYRYTHILQGNAPNLSSMSLKFLRKTERHFRDLQIFLSSSHPQLTKFELVVKGIFIKEDFSFLQKNISLMTNLTHLQIHLLGRWSMDYPSPELLTGLQPQPQPSSSSDTTNNKNLLYSLPNLHTLDIKCKEISSKLMIPFYSTLRCINLRQLKYECDTPPTDQLPFLEWINHFSHSIQHFGLVSDHWKVSISFILSILRRFINLSTLDLRCHGTSEILNILANKVEEEDNNKFYYIPKLKYLIVHLRNYAKPALLEFLARRTFSPLSPIFSKTKTESESESESLETEMELLSIVPGITSMDTDNTVATLTTVTVHAQNSLITEIHAQVLMIIESVNYNLRVEYQLDLEPWLNLALDGPVTISDFTD